jgi:hypothetical protein
VLRRDIGAMTVGSQLGSVHRHRVTAATHVIPSQ